MKNKKWFMLQSKKCLQMSLPVTHIYYCFSSFSKTATPLKYTLIYAPKMHPTPEYNREPKKAIECQRFLISQIMYQKFFPQSPNYWAIITWIDKTKIN